MSASTGVLAILAAAAYLQIMALNSADIFIKEILEERNGIFLTELASEVSKKFNLARTSEAQLEYIEKLAIMKMVTVECACD
ncbi:hypothetical protein N9Y18_03450 [Litoricolaceae bacterium]|nr:hypothetical protein [Litorivicinaceae bacterium]